MRGKYADRAERNRAAESVLGEVELLRRKNVVLVADNASLKAHVKELKQTHAKETRVLRAQRDEGLSPQLHALQHRLTEQQEKTRAAEAAWKELRAKWDRTVGRMLDYVERLEGTTRRQAVEKIMQFSNDEFEHDHTIVSGAEARVRTTEGVRAVQRARGIRR